MPRYSVRRLRKIPVLDSQGQKIGRLKDIVIETRTGDMISIVIDKVDSQVASDIADLAYNGELIIPFSVAKIDGDSITVDRKKLRLLYLKKSLKKRAIQSKNQGTNTA